MLEGCRGQCSMMRLSVYSFSLQGFLHPCLSGHPQSPNHHLHPKTYDLSGSIKWKQHKKKRIHLNSFCAGLDCARNRLLQQSIYSYHLIKLSMRRYDKISADRDKLTKNGTLCMKWPTLTQYQPYWSEISEWERKCLLPIHTMHTNFEVVCFLVLVMHARKQNTTGIY